MQNLNNDAYEFLLSDLIHDAFYTDISNRGKIMMIRAYAEIIVRQILSIPVGDEMTLGKKSVREKISEINNTLLTNAVKNIREIGNASTHTQDTSAKTEAEVAIVIDSLFDLLAYLFIRFFEEYSLESNTSIMTAFSLQPPTIRYKVLASLYEKNPEDIFIIDKLALAILKANSKEDALAWVESNKDHFNGMSSVTNEGKASIISQLGQEIGQQIIDTSPTMYDSCIDKINKVSNDANRVVYNDFESALLYYKKYGKLSGITQDEIAFNSIMEFLYLGRKENTAT